MLKNWLDYLSEDYNISFYELSKKTGIAQSTLSNIRKKIYLIVMLDLLRF